ncbi:DUF2752 domain-containing protein [Streptomyces sp. SL13]|uniref:DUF2752 domain-containing protein n=1 Tax=Streptantibioticus silvisoli TaxID=2705255 RepID=A0AA90H3Z0_9ACTN|nr:DUF2752 domain-containing protein [Streptantibioticus silvisoli]MDI5970294.1 DUF2752 domain-containing protein [Streptantibioticus silvisoli]
MPSIPRPDPAPAPAARRLVVPVAALAGVAAAFAYVGSVDPNHPGHYPVCPFLALTGWYCPACGGLRSAYAVVHGDFGGALHDNAVAVLGYAVCAVLWVLWALREARGRPVVPRRWRMTPAAWYALGGLLVVFSVVRNLPFGAALAP